MQLPCTAWVQSLKVKRDKNVENTSLHHSMTFRWPPSVRFFVYKRANSNLSRASTALTTKNTTENNCSISHAQNTITLSPNVFFNWNTSVTGHNQWAVGSPQLKALSKLNANSTDTICTQNARKNLYWGKHISEHRIWFIQQNTWVNTRIALQTEHSGWNAGPTTGPYPKLYTDNRKFISSN
jgi:hypothetical protein